MCKANAKLNLVVVNFEDFWSFKRRSRMDLILDSDVDLLLNSSQIFIGFEKVNPYSEPVPNMPIGNTMDKRILMATIFSAENFSDGKVKYGLQFVVEASLISDNDYKIFIPGTQKQFAFNSIIPGISSVQSLFILNPPLENQNITVS